MLTHAELAIAVQLVTLDSTVAGALELMA